MQPTTSASQMFTIVQLESYWWILLIVLVVAVWAWPPFLLVLFLMLWRAAEFWLTHRLLDRVPASTH